MQNAEVSMPSRSLVVWKETRLRALDPVERAHAAIVGEGPGRRYLTQQINQAFAVLLSSQFQGFCRDLHSECVDFFVKGISPASAQEVVRLNLLKGRKLDTGNPNPANLGNDFNRFGAKFKLVDELLAYDPSNQDRKVKLEELSVWRNAIAHQDFTNQELQGKATISLGTVKTWRAACKGLAISMDEVMRRQLTALLGVPPW
ncbi:MAG TPA: HEPN domain-containing protein [Pirellulales bacterium]|jgi:hypothetical protein|nr:HEPN domain-containing protein [Pirellulales bacterium]